MDLCFLNMDKLLKAFNFIDNNLIKCIVNIIDMLQ